MFELTEEEKQTVRNLIEKAKERSRKIGQMIARYEHVERAVEVPEKIEIRS